MFYSKSTGGFYAREIHGENIPGDAVELSDEMYSTLLDAQISGKVIQPGEDGFPVAVDAPAPSQNDINRMEIARLEATVTPRRLREAVLGIDGGWLANLNSQIAALRASLT